jgi:hypothetical protein
VQEVRHQKHNRPPAKDVVHEGEGRGDAGGTMLWPAGQQFANHPEDVPPAFARRQVEFNLI